MNGQDGTTTTRTAATHTTTIGWSATALHGVIGELGAFAQMVSVFPWRSFATDSLQDVGTHPVPVVFIHGLLGDCTNFAPLRRHLARHGIRRFSSFAYRPRLDYQRLATALGDRISAVCRDTGTAQVDVVGHSLGGLVARYFTQTAGTTRVRRLVTLGTPYLAHANPPQELAIFGEHDPLVPPPADRARRRMRVIGGCGHLGLLTDPRALGAVTYHLRRPMLVDRRRNTQLAA
jgi:pimeloyl-ACP methyl ester carboxylesterase